MEPPTAPDQELLERAIAGDRLSLERLLVRYQARILGRVGRKLPATLRGAIAPEDILQETLIEVYRGIERFSPPLPRAFLRWLIAIADSRLIDAIRQQGAQKRGGLLHRIDAAAEESGLVPLLEVLHATSRTPSASVAGQEALTALRGAVSELRPDYREALKLRFLDGLPVAEAASRMGRTQFAVHKLCSRGLQRLREILSRHPAWESES